MTIHESSDDQAVGLKPAGDEEPLCSEEEFAQEVRELVAEEAPQMFALVEEYGERVDGRIIGWGVAFDDHVEVLGADGGLRASFDSTEQVRCSFSRHRKIRLVETSLATSHPPEQITAVTN